MGPQVPVHVHKYRYESTKVATLRFCSGCLTITMYVQHDNTVQGKDLSSVEDHEKSCD